MKNMSSTDFCSSASKKIAGAHSASARPATRPTRLREQSRAGQAEQHARRRSDQRLDDADDQQVAAEDRVDDAEKIRVERRLVEDFGTDPVAGGEPLRPLVVAVGVAEQRVEEGRALAAARCGAGGRRGRRRR